MPEESNGNGLAARVGTLFWDQNISPVRLSCPTMSPLRRLQRVFPPTSLLFLAVAVACVSEIKPPAAPLRGTLAVPGPSGIDAKYDNGPLRVVFGTPQGQTAQRTEVSLVFSKPMRVIGAEDKDPPVRMTPDVPGRWQWLGSSALRFNPSGDLPLATSFRVDVPEGITALDGTKLEQAYSMSFSTPRPALIRSEPANEEKGVLPNATLCLWFDQQIALPEVARAVSLSAGSPIPFTVDEDEACQEGLRVKPTKPLPLGADITLRVDEFLRPITGDLTAGKEHVVRFKTLEPPRAEALTCEPHPDDPGACNPDETSLTLRFNNPVSVDAVVSQLRITPKPKDYEVSPHAWEFSDEFTISGYFEPRKSYRAYLGRARVRDEGGQVLSGDFSTALRFGDRLPRVYFGATGTYWPGKNHVVPISVLNASNVKVWAKALSPSDVLSKLVGGVPNVGQGPSFQAPTGKRNEKKESSFRLEDILAPPGTRGPVHLETQYDVAAGKEKQRLRREFQLTEVGMISRAGRDGGVVWLTNLHSGRPIPNARVEAFAIPSAEGAKAQRMSTVTADNGGLARFAMSPPQGSDRLAIFAHAGSDWAYQTLPMPRAPRLAGFVFDERGIYRPGETVHLTGVLRQPAVDGLKTIPGTVKLTVKDPHAKQVASKNLTLSEFGTFATSILVPSDAALGSYRVQAEMDGSSFEDGFRVDEYVPLENTIDAATDRAFYRRGDPMTCTVRGDYLHGGPMAGADATVSITRGSGGYTVPGLERYTVNDLDVRVPTTTIARVTGKLDGRGSLVLPASLSFSDQRGTESLSCAAEVMDLNRRAQQTWSGATVHPGDLYVALEVPQGWKFDPGQVVTARTLVVTPEGQRRSRPVHVEMLLRHRSAQGDTTDEKVISKCDVTPGSVPGTCTFRAPAGDPGERAFILVRAGITDDRGLALRASFERPLEAPPKPVVYSPPPPPAPYVPQPRLEVRATEREYSPGDTAVLEIRSGFASPSEALVTFEREGVIGERRVRLNPHGGGPTKLDVPVTRAMIPGVRVTVVAIDGWRSEQETGYLDVRPDSRGIAVKLNLGGPEAEPGETLDVEVLLRDAAGKPVRGEVTLWAADEGSLMLANYRTPDPLFRMYDWRQVLVEGADSREDLVRTGWFSRRTRAPQVRMGATSVNPRRGDFRQTVFYAPQLRTDASGRVRRRVTLPDGLTKYRFMALAVAKDDRFGAAEEVVVTNKPLMLRTTLPRVLRAGDTFEASVIVSTKDLPETDVTVDMSARGIKAVGPGRKQLRLSPERPVEVRFPFRAERAGPVRLLVDARAAEGDTDGVDLKRKVVTPTLIETVTVSGETSGAVAERIADLTTIRDDVGELRVTVGATPLSGLEAGFDQILDYPYGCTEQTVSRMVPLLVARGLASALGVQTDAKRSDDLLRAAVRDVVASQQPGGGFGFWPGSSESNAWITAYAMWGLGHAKRHGIQVPAATLPRAKQWLAKRSTKGELDPLDWNELSLEAFVIDVLAEAGEDIGDRAAKLFEHRERLSVHGKALLLHAMGVHAKRDAFASERQRLVGDLASVIRLDGPNAHVVTQTAENHDPSGLDTSARTTAMVLRALLAEDSKHAMVGRLARGILANRRDGRWRSTHEAAWALVALDGYHRALTAPGAGFSTRVFLGDDLLLSEKFDPTRWARTSHVVIPMARLAAMGSRPLTFAVEGQGALHYDARLRFARSSLPAEPMEAGMFVHKVMRPVGAVGRPGDGLAVDGAKEHSFLAGQLVVCEVEVVTPSPRHNVVVEDPLPGGFEATGFSHGREWLFGGNTLVSHREVRDDRVLFFVDRMSAGISRFQYVARATSVGRFVMPPARAEEMYVPDTFGSTPASWVRVVGR